MPITARPGFLIALADLLLPAAPPKLQYVFAGKAYDLTVVRAERGTETFQSQRLDVVRATFEIHNLATHARRKFDMVYGTAGDLTGVPLSVAWQPRWWLKVKLPLLS